MTTFASDIQVSFIRDEVALDADGISTAASVSEDAALTINGALASGGSVTNASGRQVTILSAGDDSGNTFTVVGTDVNEAALTEAVTGANAGTATSSGYFKTIASITLSGGDSGGNVSAGINGNAADVVFAGRMRLKGYSIVSGGTAGEIDFLNSGVSGTSIFKARTIGTDNTTLDNTVPAEGILFKDGMFVTFVIATIDMMTFFYA
jgi:hypothetical protein|tara:strand:- start:6 stop:626 length:621 start_codon:yes stop_codon:yes gene_type:complete